MKKTASKAATTAKAATNATNATKRSAVTAKRPAKGSAGHRASRRADASTGAPSTPADDRATEPRVGDPQSVPRGAKHLLTAGIKALTTAHEEVVARQSRVFESLLGVNRGDAPDPKPVAAPDPFGFRKFEDVFDQRVASALQHLGVPSADAFATLRAEVETLRARLDEAVAALQAARPRR